MRPPAPLLAIIVALCSRPTEGAPLRAPGLLEDPSDALWLRWYNDGNEFVTLLSAAAAALCLLLLAMAADGAWFDPRRASVSAGALGALSSCGAAALLLLVGVPRRWQPSLAGGGPLQTCACIVVVCVLGALLPAGVLATQAAVACAGEWALLCLQVAAWAAAGLAQFALALVVFHARSLLLQIGAVYAGARDDVDVYSWQLVYSGEFLRTVGRNGLLVNVPGAVNRMCRVVLRSAMAPHLYERIVGHGSLSVGEGREGSGQSTPLAFEEAGWGAARRAAARGGASSSDESTPLLSPVEDRITVVSGRFGSHIFVPEV